MRIVGFFLVFKCINKKKVYSEKLDPYVTVKVHLELSRIMI